MSGAKVMFGKDLKASLKTGADKAAAEQGIPSTEAVLTSEMLDESE